MAVLRSKTAIEKISRHMISSFHKNYLKVFYLFYDILNYDYNTDEVVLPTKILIEKITFLE
jgi:hypothetical protein